MPDGQPPPGTDSRSIVAQAFYLAQLQACKGKCQCNVCKLLRKAVDLQTQVMLHPQTPLPGVEDLSELVTDVHAEER